jgi:T-complex protein 1 subunit eta
VADAVRTTLGPRGMDKLIRTGPRTTISNDGATLMKLLEIAHPAAKVLVDISQAQDDTVGDGTTSVVLLAAEILKGCKAFVEDHVHPQIIQHHVRLAGQMAVDFIRQELQVVTPEAATDEYLLKCCSTALNSKLISSHQDLFSPMVVKAVQNLGDEHLDQLTKWIGIQKIPGGDVRQSFLVKNGVAFSKTFSYAGFEQMTKKFQNPKILLLNVELELKAEKENAEVRISSPEDYQSIVQAEWDVIYDKLDLCVTSGAHIVLSILPIGDLATQYFSDRGMFCAGRVPASDMARIAMATASVIQTTCRGITPDVLGTCGNFEEVTMGDERINVLEDCPNTLVSTIVLRGGSEQFIAESERSLHDALMVVKRCLQDKTRGVVAGGGAVELEVSQYLRRYSLTIAGKGQLIVAAYAKALEIIPRQLCDNAGFDSTDVLAALRKLHATAGENPWMGVDIEEGGVCNTFDKGVWEPSDNKLNSLQAATEAACVILSIDETIVSPKSQDPSIRESGQLPSMGGNPMGAALDHANAMKGGSRSGNLGQGVSWMKGRGGG